MKKFLIASFFLMAFLPSFSHASDLIIDNFDTYNLGYIGNQGAWHATSNPSATSTQYYSSSYSLSNGTSTAPYVAYQNYTGTPTTTDTISYLAYVDGVTTSTGPLFYNYANTASNMVTFCGTADANKFDIRVLTNNTNCTTGSVAFAGVSKRAWHSILISFTGVNSNFTLTVDGVATTSQALSVTWASIRFSFLSSGANPVYIDNLGAIYGFQSPVTRFISVEPPNNDFFASTTNFGVDTEVYISEADYVNDMTATWEWKYIGGDSYFCRFIGYFSGDCNAGKGNSTTTVLTELSYPQTYGEAVATVNNLGNLEVGSYTLKTTIRKPYWLFFDEEVISTTTTFTVDAKTTFQQKWEDNKSIIQGALNLSNGDVGTTCAIATFSLSDCLGGLFLVDSDQFASSTRAMKDYVYTRFPIGYLTDFKNIITSTTTIPLVPIDATVPAGIAGTGSHITLDLTHVLDPVLNATTSQFNNVSASSTETFFQITYRYWKYISYVALLLYIIGRIMGSHLIPQKKLLDKNKKS